MADPHGNNPSPNGGGAEQAPASPAAAGTAYEFGTWRRIPQGASGLVRSRAVTARRKGGG
jgi:hypothetical protein